MKLPKVLNTISDERMANIRRRAEQGQRKSGKNWLTDPGEIKRRKGSLANFAKRQAS
jgi:hypothetical protein